MNAFKHAQKTLQREPRPRTYETNPFLSWTSTYKERQESESVMLDPQHTRKKVSVETWLYHLRSSLTLSGQPKNQSVRERDLKTYEKFWRVANGRGLLKQFFDDPNLNEGQIVKKMKEAGFRMSHQHICLIRQRWCPERKTLRTEGARHRKAVLAVLEEHPEWSYRTIGQRAGTTEACAWGIAKAAGIKKPNSLKIPEKERAAREKFLEDAGIECTTSERKTGIGSIADMAERILHMLNEHDYAVRNYAFLRCTAKKVDTSIGILDEYGIDWRDYEKELWRLIGNSPNYIRSQMKLLNDVGASPELHHLLLKKLSGKLKCYASDKPLYADLRRVVVENDVQSILTYAKRVAHHTLAHRKLSRREEYFELAQDAALLVLGECSRSEKNPADLLALMSAAVEVAIDNETRKIARTGSTEDFSVDDERIGTKMRRRQPSE